jgi:hypothetical protein
MDRTADKPTSLRTPWREARKRAGSFDELRPYLHVGQIPAHHGGLFAFPEGNQRSGPGILRPEMWAHAYEDRAGRRVIFITDEVVFGQLVREQVFAYASGIEFDSAAFDTFFPVAGFPPAEHQEPRRETVEVDAAAPGQAHPGPAAPEPAPSSPQGESEPPPPPKPKRAKAVSTRGKRDPVIEMMKAFYPLDGIRPKSVSIAALTKRINKLSEFKENPVSEDTVERADKELQAGRKK